MSFWGDGALNPEQEEAINEPGNVFLIACPGSGKTRTLTYKVASELSKLDTGRQFVAAITYTHRAADEIEERIADLGVDTGQLWIGTIHAFCLEWILKPYGVYHPALMRGFHVINSHEREIILTRLCLPYSQQKINFHDCGFYFIESGYELECQDVTKHGSLHQILASYFAELRAAGQIDFELILLYAHQLLRNMPTISTVLSKVFSFIAMDEYQDTKKIQYLIVAAILKAGAGSTRTFIVGDPNQAIFTSLGGYAISLVDFQKMIGSPLKGLQLSRNYRSSERIINYFGNFTVHGTVIESASQDQNFASIVTLNQTVTRDELESELIRLIRYNIEEVGIAPGEICVLAPWWTHLAGMTRRLVASLPEYEFDGPGMVPFAHDWDNFWFKLARIALTDASPQMYVSRLRWAGDILQDLDQAGVDASKLTNRSLLRESNGIVISASDGLAYLSEYFVTFFNRIDINFSVFPSLQLQHTAFFDSSRARIDRLASEGAAFVSDINSFRRVFRKRSGITISTIHGVKGAEFDTVIAYALLEGMVPHFKDEDKRSSAKKLLYVIGSRARKNLHLISERGRVRYGDMTYETTTVLRRCVFNYDASIRLNDAAFPPPWQPLADVHVAG